MLNSKYYIHFFVGKMLLRKYMVLTKLWSTISAIAVQTFHPVDLQGGRFFYLNFSNFKALKNKLNWISISTCSQSILYSVLGSIDTDTHLLQCCINQYVLAFYTLYWTPYCLTQIISFEDIMKDFRNWDCNLLSFCFI